MAALLAGLLCGACVLTRTEMLLVGAAAGLLLLWHHRARWRTAILAAATLGIATACVVAPWTVRNQVVFDRVIPVANASGYNMWKAFGPYARGSGNQVGTAPDSVAALEAIAASVPLGDAPGARYESRVQDAYAADTARFMARTGAAHLAVLTGQKLVLLWLFDWTDPLTHGLLYWAPWLVVNLLALVGAWLMVKGTIRTPGHRRCGNGASTARGAHAVLRDLRRACPVSHASRTVPVPVCGHRLAGDARCHPQTACMTALGAVPEGEDGRLQ